MTPEQIIGKLIQNLRIELNREVIRTHADGQRAKVILEAELQPLADLIRAAGKITVSFGKYHNSPQGETYDTLLEDANKLRAALEKLGRI